MNTVPHWKEHLMSYDKVVELEFSTMADSKTAVRKLFQPPLSTMPYQIEGKMSFAVPAEAVKYFEGLNFESVEIPF